MKNPIIWTKFGSTIGSIKIHNLVQILSFSSDQPLFMCVSKNMARTSSSEAPNIRRLSPGYCIRVHRMSSFMAMNQNAVNVVANDVSHHAIESTTAMSVNPVSLLTISIGSGWGANYDQKSIATLHCRYEVIFT